MLSVSVPIRLEPSEFDKRRGQLIAALEERQLDALLVTFILNVRYLTGFTGSNAALLISPKTGALLLTDPRYELQAAAEVTCPFKVSSQPLLQSLMAFAGRKKLRRLGFEKSRLPYADFEFLNERLPLGASLIPVNGVVENLRIIKSHAEVALIRQSVLTTSKAYERVIRKLRPGIREIDLAADLEHQMRLLGAEKPAFDTIVASGPRTAFPHARPTYNAIASNQLVLIDMGSTCDGYVSDMTRMACPGAAGRKARRIHAAVLEAQLEAVQAVRPGITAAQVDRVARKVLRSHGFESYFTHSTGHGLGLEIHEPPRIGKRSRTKLAAGMVITIEPGAYLEGFGGIRIEDTVVVTPTGCEVLTPSAKELLTL